MCNEITLPRNCTKLIIPKAMVDVLLLANNGTPRVRIATKHMILEKYCNKRRIFFFITTVNPKSLPSNRKVKNSNNIVMGNFLGEYFSFFKIVWLLTSKFVTFILSTLQHVIATRNKLNIDAINKIKCH